MKDELKEKMKQVKKVINRIDGNIHQTEQLNNTCVVHMQDNRGNNIMTLKGDDAKMIESLVKKFWEEQTQNLMEKLNRDYGMDIEA